jgi:hypothetical protein
VGIPASDDVKNRERQQGEEMDYIRRNDPCPCGSGKTYKKCCMGQSFRGIPKYQVARTIHWSREEIRTFSTTRIIQKLRSFGIDFQQETFLQDTQHYTSAEALAQHWAAQYQITAFGLDGDFPWMACLILWERLAPDVVNVEQLDSAMQQGYDLLRTEGSVAACTVWLNVWEQLKPHFSPTITAIEQSETIFSGMQSLYNWCQDVEIELSNAGHHDPTFHQKRLTYCQEFCTFFPESEPLILVNMYRAVAESHLHLGDVTQADACFASLVEQFPTSPWGYIGWGDMYRGFPISAVPPDYERAKRIYRMALEHGVEEEQYVQERLTALENVAK